MNEPLDLRALEARLKFGDSLDAAECGALVAALRAHHVALADLVAGLYVGPMVPDEKLSKVERAYRRAVGVLASCTDHEEAPASQE